MDIKLMARVCGVILSWTTAVISTGVLMVNKNSSGIAGANQTRGEDVAFGDAPPILSHLPRQEGDK